MNGVMNSVEVQRFCTLSEVGLTSGSAVFSFYAHFEVLLGAVGDNVAEEFSEFRSVFSFFQAAFSQ